MQLPRHIADAIAACARVPGNRSFYVYEPARMRWKIRRILSLMPPNLDIYYVVKANSHPAFLAAALEGAARGLEISSIEEGRRAIAAGFSADRLIFTNPGKTVDDLTWSVAAGIRTMHVDSLMVAHRLQNICSQVGSHQDILVRVDPIDGTKVGKPVGSESGWDFTAAETALEQFIKATRELDRLTIRGFHVYLPSGELELGRLMSLCEACFSLARRLEERHPGLCCEYLDLGGGFGVGQEQSGDDFPLQDYGRFVGGLNHEFGFDNRRLIVRLGRFLANTSGWYCSEIIDIRNGCGGKKELLCAGGAHHFRRPTAHKINHPLGIVRMGRADGAPLECADNEDVNICGSVGKPSDSLAARDIYVSHANVGDVAVFGLAGAYGLCNSPADLLSQPRPNEFVV